MRISRLRNLAPPLPARCARVRMPVSCVLVLFLALLLRSRLVILLFFVTRMGKDGVHPGTAYTLVTPKQATFAGELAYHLEVGLAHDAHVRVCQARPVFGRAA